MASTDTLGSVRQGRSKGLLRRIWESRYPYLFILPFYFWFFLLDVFPILYSAYLSFHKWDGLGEMKYRGLANYTRAFKDTRFVGSLKTTTYLWLGHIFVMLALALLLAVVLDSKLIRGRTVYRAIFYLPNVTPIAAMALVFGLVFDHHFGILNAGLAAIGLEAVPWLTEPNWARISIIILNTWGATGWYMLIMLAGLQSIDPALYEAAEVDGSNTLQKLFYITIPSLKNILFFCFIVETIGSFEIFIEPNVLTGGGPLNATLSTSLYLYNTAFQYNKFGYSAAMSFVLFAIIAVASAIQLVLMRREEAAYA